MSKENDKTQTITTCGIADLVDGIADLTKLTKKDVRAVIDAMFDLIKLRVRQDERVIVKNFGAFCKTLLAPGKRYDMKTGKVVERPAKHKVRFVVSSHFLED